MKTAISRRFYLNNAEIDRCSEEVFGYLIENKINKKRRIISKNNCLKDKYREKILIFNNCITVNPGGGGGVLCC